MVQNKQTNEQRTYYMAYRAQFPYGKEQLIPRAEDEVLSWPLGYLITDQDLFHSSLVVELAMK